MIFQRSARRYAWTAATGTMGHCWVMWSKFYPEPGILAHEWTLKAEHTPGGLYVDMTPANPADMAAQALAMPGVIDVLRHDILVQRVRMRYFGLLNCVTVVKSVLNLDAPWCLTPAQLHRRLLIEGARSLREDSDGGGAQ